MKIGIDLDGVIFDTERTFRFYSDIWDLEHHGLNNVIDDREVNFQQRYNWTEEEKEEFYSKYVYDLELKSGFFPGVKETLLYLKSLGYELYVITARGFYSQEQIDITMKLLKDEGLDIFDDYFFKSEDKKKVILDNKIDYMIEDHNKICESIKDICKVIYLKSAYSKTIEDSNVVTVYGWHEIYRYFKKIEEEG